MNNAAILIIDDELQIRRLLEITLQSNGYRTEQAATAKEGLTAAANHPPDLVLLDIGLPDESGHAVLKKLRQWYAKPVIMLSVQDGEDAIVESLDNGANDYLVKPFRTGELLARIRSALRESSAETGIPVLSFGNLMIDLSARIVKKENVHLKLTVTEYALLSLFMKNEGRVLTHQYLLRQVWGPGYIEQSQYLRVYIAQLRKKIETDPNRPQYIMTAPGIGYRFVGTE